MTNKRQHISKKTRFNVFKRDSFTCQYCGNKPPKVVLEIDHIIPVSKSGGNQELNLITACFDCNRGKSNHSLKDTPEPIGNMLSREMESANQLKELNKFLKKQKKENDKLINELSKYWFNNFQGGQDLGFKLSKKRIPSFRNFLKYLPYSKIEEAMDLSFSQCSSNYEGGLWKYFCAICWNWIKVGKENKEYKNV